MSEALYRTAGRALFTCPALAERIQALGVVGVRSAAALRRYHLSLDRVAPFRQLTDAEQAILAFDGGGHSEWEFSWGANHYHIDHPANGGVPACGCGRRLILTACTSDPGAGS